MWVMSVEHRIGDIRGYVEWTHLYRPLEGDAQVLRQAARFGEVDTGRQVGIDRRDSATIERTFHLRAVVKPRNETWTAAPARTQG